MGRATVPAAAEITGASERTIWAWVRGNKITRYTTRGLTTVELYEVQAMLDAESRLEPTPQLMAVMSRRLEKLEREIEFLLYIGGQTVPLEMSREEALMAYSAAKKQCERTLIVDEDIDSLVGMLNTIPEEALEIILEAKNDPHPWVPFFQLCRKLKNQIRSKSTFHTNTIDQGRYRHLLKAEERLRAIALVFIESDTDASTRKDLLNSVGSQPLLGYELIRRVVWSKDRKTHNPLEPLSDDPKELLEEALEILDARKVSVHNKKRVVRRLERAIEAVKGEKKGV